MFVRFYKITSTNTEKVYIGSTKMTLENRLHFHEIDYKTFLENGIKKITSRHILCQGNYSIHLLEERECKDEKEQNQIEQNYILNEPNSVNRIRRLGIRKIIGHGNEYAKMFYYTQNNNRAKEFYKEHKEEILNRAKQIITCEICGGQYDYSHKTTHLKSKKHRNALSR